MSTEIYYFSGTGNSQYIAKELEKRIPDTNLIPIISLLDKDVIKTKGKIIGFVFPIHALTMPIVLKRFLKKIGLNSAEYIFAVATRGRTTHQAFNEMEKILKKKGRVLDSYFTITMGHNDPKIKDYVPESDEELSKLEYQVQDKLNFIHKIITSKEKSREKDTEFIIPVNFLLEKLIISGMAVSEHIGGVNYFYTDSKCIGCKNCEKVCLSNKIKMVNKNPVWDSKIFCYMCYACINFCPTQSIQIKDIPFFKSYTGVNGRYSHPYAAVDDINQQKRSNSKNFNGGFV